MNTIKTAPAQSKGRILLFIDWFAPGFRAGGPVQSNVNMIENLREHFSFKVITRDTDYQSVKPYPHIQSDSIRQVDKHLEVYYASENQLTFRTILHFVRQNDYNLVYINGIYSFYFSILPLWLSVFLGKKVVVAPRGMLSGHALLVKSKRKRLFLMIGRLVGIYKRVCFHATNTDEADEIRKVLGKNLTIQLAPNIPRNADNDSVQKIDKKPGTLRLAYIGRIAPEKNQLFAIRQLQYIKNSLVEYHLYGSIYSQAYWQQCQRAIGQLPPNIRVVHKGELQSNLVLDIISQYHFLYMPSTGENFGHAIYESFLSARPVIISNKTPWQHLSEKQAGYDIDLGNEAEFRQKLAEAVAMSQQEYAKLQAGARNLATHFLENEGAVPKTIALFERCM